MIINWYGQSYFKIESRGSVLAIDPYQEEIGLKPPRFKADIVLVSHNHNDHNNTKVIMGDFLLLNGPGEIEKQNIFVEGLISYHDAKGGAYRGFNTIFIIQAEDLRIVHLGDLGEKKLREETLEKIDEVDILMIPVGGEFTILTDDAISIINQIEPKIVIPMHYKLPGLKVKLHPLDEFIKAFGKKPEIMDKLVIKKNDLPNNLKLIVLNKQ